MSESSPTTVQIANYEVAEFETEPHYGVVLTLRDILPEATEQEELVFQNTTASARLRGDQIVIKLRGQQWSAEKRLVLAKAPKELISKVISEAKFILIVLDDDGVPLLFEEILSPTPQAW